MTHSSMLRFDENFDNNVVNAGSRKTFLVGMGGRCCHSEDIYTRLKICNIKIEEARSNKVMTRVIDV